MIVVTWNVLHRIHAVNWDEPAIRGWPDEPSRIGSIADLLAELPADVICLQEVSGDQLAMLRDVVPGELFATRYPRVPRYTRRFEAATLRDPAEYLVTIVRDGGARLLAEEAFPSDRGKGFHALELASGATVIDTHVSFGDKGVEQLARLASIARDATEPAIVCGDFNAPRETCAAALGAAFVPAVSPRGALATRPPTTPDAPPQDIDHVLVRGAQITAVQVLDSGGRSDHNPVAVRLSR